MIRAVAREDVADLVATAVAALKDGRGQVQGSDELPTAAAMAAHVERHSTGDRSGEHGGMWVAEDGGAVVGEATLQRLGPALCRHVASLALQVHPAHQGRGHGRGLLQAVVARAGELGIRRLQLDVRADNHRAIRLYRSAGFAVEGRRAAFVRLPDGRSVDDLAMVRHLDPPAAEKACGLVLRGADYLVLQHPLAGWQLPKGTIDPGETPAEAVVREVAEETGLAGLPITRSLGWWTQCSTEGDPVHRWHAFALRAPDDTPDAWDHTASGSPEEDGLVFRLAFRPLGARAWHAFHPAFHEALVRVLAP